jgi:hypothetical protein
MGLGSTQALTDMSTSNLPQGKQRPADLTAIGHLSTKCTNLDVTQPYGPPRLVYRDSFTLPYSAYNAAWELLPVPQGTQVDPLLQYLRDHQPT